MRRLAWLLLLPLLFAACDGQSVSAAEEEIRGIIDDIERDFNWQDIEGIMAHVHPDYRHNGMYINELRNLWYQRRANYELLECTVSQVLIEDYYATVFLRLEFFSSGGNLSYEDPQTSGDASYFIYSGGNWQLWGNQELN